MCSTYNFKRVVQGDIIAKTMTFTEKITGDPMDLSIYTAIKMQIRKKPGTAVIAEGSLLDGNFTVSGADNNILEISGIEIPDATPVGVYMYDIEFSAPADDIRDTLIGGTMNIVPQITTTA